jgi:hypothetical protein
MPKLGQGEAIATFWRWFEGHRELVEQQDLTADTVEELERYLFEVDRIDWEIACGRSCPHSLTLSPSNRSGLRKAQRLIARAPRLDGWEFWAGKPARRWALTFEVARNGAAIFVDGKAWEFVVHQRRDGSHIVLKAPLSQGLSEAEVDCAAIIIVDGELGEAARLLLVSTIETVDFWNADEQMRARILEPGALGAAVGVTARDSRSRGRGH